MPFTLLDPQPENLAANEIAVDLEGTLVAVSVTTSWQDNNAGVVFLGTARHIMADGTACLCGNGQEVKTVLSHVADLASVQELGQQVIAKQVMLALLGEPLDTHEVDGEQVPLIPWGT